MQAGTPAFPALSAHLSAHLRTKGVVTNNKTKPKTKEQRTKHKDQTTKYKVRFLASRRCVTIRRGGGKRSAAFVTDVTMIEPTPLIRETEVVSPVPFFMKKCQRRRH